MRIGDIASGRALKLTGAAHKNTASGSSKDLIDSLNQRKDDINKQKAEYRKNAVKQGKSQEEIDAKISEYDAQISKISAQISQIEQDKKNKEAEKAADKSNSNSASKTDTQEFSEQTKAQQKQLMGLASVQAGEKSIHAVKFAKSVLKSEALVHAPSFAYGGEPEKAAQLNSTADSLDAKIAHITKEMKESGKKAAESAPKTYEQTAAETYQNVADSADGEAIQPGDNVDVFA
jgi:DNA repair exonuclease SbcCD ATPase subunit